MGCTKGDGDCSRNEYPVHRVTISHDYYMMKSEVTQKLYNKVYNRSGLKGDSRPVRHVSWYGAVKFANALSVQMGLEECYSISGKDVIWPKGVKCTGWRLPTEAEWEYAARGGEEYKYSGSNSVSYVGWTNRNSASNSHSVCGKEENGYGLCDMSGNVFEWVWDRYGYYSSTSVTDPTGPSTGTERVFRGGSWCYTADRARVSDREGSNPSVSGNRRAFRLTRTIR